MILSGQVDDQAAFYGILNKIRDLGLPLLTMERELLSPPIAWSIPCKVEPASHMKNRSEREI